MNEKKLVPRRRFEEFQNADAWEQCKLSDVADYYDGTHQTPKYTDEGVKFISVENIKNIQDSNKYISENDYEKQFKIKPQIDDIFMTRITAGVIGDTALVEQDGPLAYYVSLALIRPKSIVPLYLEKYISSPFFKSELHKRIIHTAFPKKINLGDIGECGIKITKSKKEQIQIGEFFKKIDNTIALHQRKLEKTKALKSAYLAEMFPAEGKRVPKRRFAGFNDEWKEWNLGDKSNIHTGESDAQDAETDGEYPFFIRSENIKRSNRYTFDGEAILIPGEGRLGEIYHYFNGKFDYHQRVYKISDFDKDISGKFIYYIMHKSFKKHALKYTVKATVDSLRLPMLTEYNIKSPTYEEQVLIVQLFDILEQNIKNQQQKLKKLKAMKQAYLAEMFI